MLLGHAQSPRRFLLEASVGIVFQQLGIELYRLTPVGLHFMALTGLQIYKQLPKTNCKDCGFPTCLAFAM